MLAGGGGIRPAAEAGTYCWARQCPSVPPPHAASCAAVGFGLLSKCTSRFTASLPPSTGPRIKLGSYSEADARRLVREMARAVAQCHGMDVMLRDIKPENVRLTCRRTGQGSSRAAACFVRFSGMWLRPPCLAALFLPPVRPYWRASAPAMQLAHPAGADRRPLLVLRRSPPCRNHRCSSSFWTNSQAAR
jgi:serine/threonine protein kinase